MLRTSILCLFACACASGTAETDGGGRRDASTDGALRDGSRIDGTAGDGGVDAFVCVDDDYTDECTEAVPIVLRDGDEPNVIEGVLPNLSDSDWFAVEFPPQSLLNMQGLGMPSINLDGDDTMILDIRETCAATLPVSCGEGSAREATSYSFVDDQSLPGEVDGDGSDTFTTRDVAWPAFLYVRVGRRGGPANCDPYTLTFSR